MNLIFADGIMGAGKTLGMSILATDWAKRSGCTLYSNYGLIGSKPFTSFSDFIDVARQPSSIIVLDESHMDISSRDFNSNSVKWFTNIVFYLRKLRCTLIMTSPLFENVDARVRSVTNVYIQVSKDDKYFNYDFYDVQEGRFMKTKRMKREVAEGLGSELFDTMSMVTPLEYPEKKPEFVSILERIKFANVEYLSSKSTPA